MIIEIPDDVSPVERHRLLKLYPIAYALCLHNFSCTGAGKWLNISARGVQQYMRKDELLRHLVREASARLRSREKNTEESRANSKYDYWRPQREAMVERFKRSFDYLQMNEEQRQQVMENFNKLYNSGGANGKV